MSRAYLGGGVWTKWDGEKMWISTETRESLGRWIVLDAKQLAALRKELDMLGRYSPLIQESQEASV